MTDEKGEKMNVNGNQPSDFTQVVAGLNAIADRLQADADQKRAALAETEQELRRIRSMLNVATRQTTVKPGPKAKRSSPRGEEQLGIIVRQLRDLSLADDPDIPGSFTARTVAEKLGMKKSVAERAINRLRNDGVIRLVGERKMGPGRVSRLFVIDDD